jgi:hypothetical protein
MDILCRLPELLPEQAHAESHTVCDALLAMADRAENKPCAAVLHTERYWNADAGTYTYHTHTRVACVHSSILKRVVDNFFTAASLAVQPWYPPFLYGNSMEVIASVGAKRAAIIRPVFDFGVKKKHGYCQLLTEFSMSEYCCVHVLRSVKTAEGVPAGITPAFTLSPTGDVFRWHENSLHWHHICTVSGVGLLPPTPERYVMNTLRWLGLDHAERSAYRKEAEQFIVWVSGMDTE